MERRNTEDNQSEVLKDFTELLKLLRSADPEERKSTFQKLAEMNDPVLIPPCRSLMINKDPILRFVGCEMLGMMSDFESVPGLITCLRDEDKNVRLAACRSLSKIPDVRSITPLLDRLKDHDKTTKNAALKALETLGDAQLAKAILNEKMDSLIEIAESGDPRSIEPLLEMAEHKNNMAGKYIKQSLVKLYERYESEVENMLCVTHFTRFGKFAHRKIKAGMFKRLPIFGCRICNRLLTTMTDIKQVVAVLDDKMMSYAMFDDGIFEVNYLQHNNLFDFDKVDIRRIDEKDFKTFTKRLAKNTDNLLSKKCANITCEIHRNSGLPINDIEMSKTIFGTVKLSEKYH